MFDWTISLGNVLTLGGFAFGGVAFVYAVRQDVAVLAERLKPLEAAVVQLTNILVTQARNEVRLDAVERDMKRNDSRQHGR